MHTRSVIAVTVLALAGSAHADIINFTAFLDGLQETPPVATPGIGSATMTLDTVTLQFDMVGTFQNLIGTTNNAHVHGPSPFGGPAAGVMFGHPFDVGVTSGNFSFSGVISAAHAAIILDDLAYINIHTTFRPGGEIRGQIIPSPSAFAVLSLGGLVLTRRRR